MSYFGKNIKKIRRLKKLSQTAFAELFDLNRGNISAYEEGRSEAKIDTVIRIAKYFSISIDKLLTKELTINEIYNFDIFKKHLNHNSKGALIEPARQFPQVSFLKKTDFAAYGESPNRTEFAENLPKLCLPGAKNSFLAIENPGRAMQKANSGIFPGDILICSPLGKNTGFSSQEVFALVLKNEVKTTRLQEKDDHFGLFFDNPDFPNEFLPKKQALEIWKVESILSSQIPPATNFSARLNALEKRIETLEKQKEK